MIKAEMSWCLTLQKTTERCYLKNAECYINTYSNNKSNGYRRELELIWKSSAAVQLNVRKITELHQQSLQSLTLYHSVAGRRISISLSKHGNHTFHPFST